MEPPRRDEVRPGSLISSYRVLDRIAIGGFGTVWKAEHVDTREPVALKVLHAHLIFSEKLVIRFEREAEAIARMAHANIVKLLEQGRLDDGRPYFVMEYLEGTDLRAYLSQRGALPPEEILSILEQLGAALELAHAEKIVHRDLKASNVFLCGDGAARRVVLFDFGIAKLLGDNAPDITASQSLLGSPSCMSPEQIQNQEVGPHTDVYALGSLTYQMLTGKAPFADANPATVLSMHMQARPPSPSLQGGVSPVFDEVVLKALNKSPADRYPSAAAFVAAFRDALAQSREVASAKREAPQLAPALGLYVEVRAPDAGDDPDDELLEDMEQVLDLAGAKLRARGFLFVHEYNDAALYVRPLPPGDDARLVARREAVDQAVGMFRDLAGRPDADPRVAVCVCLHVANASIVDRKVGGGPLLNLSRWATATSVHFDGVLATAEVIADLKVSAEPLSSNPSLFHVRA